MIEKLEKIENLLKIGNYEKMYRINHNGKRLYIRENPFKYYVGLTSSLDHVRFNGEIENRVLTKWRDKFIDQHGKKMLNDYVDLTADFGTLVHEAIVAIKENKKINWNEEHDKAEGYFIKSFKEKGMDANFRVIKPMILEYQKNVASLMQWAYDMVHEIYAVETPVRWEEMNIATPVDIYCNCKATPKGNFQNTTMNIKTSSQISSHQIEQASCEMEMWNDTYGGAMATGIIRTKDWKKNPTYDTKIISAEEALKKSWFIRQKLSLALGGEHSYYPDNITNKMLKGESVIGEEIKFTEQTLEEEWNEFMENKI